MRTLRRVRELALRAGRLLARRRPESRATQSIAYRLRPWLSRRVPRVGTITTGSSLFLDPRDIHHAHIWFFGTYEPGNTRLLKRLVRPGCTFLDVGANAGYYSALASDLGAATVVAFEPNPALAELIRRSGFPVVQAAVGATVGEATLYLSKDKGNTGTSSIREHYWGVGEFGITVPLITLDGYCERHRISPDVVKIDVEGAEAQVLEGMVRLLDRQAPTHLLCELSQGPARPDPRSLIQRMNDSGYNAAVVGEDGTLRPAVEFDYADVLFTARA